MKKFLMLVLLVLNSSFLIAQKNKKNVVQPDTSLSWKVYNNAMSMGDLEVAKSALYQLIAHLPGNVSIYDSLAHVYFLLGDYSRVLLASDRANIRNDNVSLREIKAYAARNTGDLKIALSEFEALYKEKNNPEYGYQVAAIRFNLKRYGECMEMISSIIENPESKSKKVIISTEDGKSQEVSYRAAAQNMKGVLFLEMGKEENAKVAFEESLKEEPGFKLAESNLDNLKNKSLQK
jgi:tetratricopeptide (TPR) repeat protein